MSSINKINIKGVTYNIGGSLEAIEWSPSSNMDNLTTSGEFEISGRREQSYQDGMPIINGGEFHAFLKVYSNSDASYISQIITLDNLAGGDTNTYIRNKQNGVWSRWSKQQGNVEVGAIGEGCEKTFNDLTESGIYSGVNITKSGYNYQETFVLIVINDILYGSGATQLKYSLDATGGTRVIKLQKRLGYHTDNGIAWTNWEDVNDNKITKKILFKTEVTQETIINTSEYRKAFINLAVRYAPPVKIVATETVDIDLIMSGGADSGTSTGIYVNEKRIAECYLSAGGPYLVHLSIVFNENVPKVYITMHRLESINCVNL
jgi:hypothetical protein